MASERAETQTEILDVGDEMIPETTRAMIYRDPERVGVQATGRKFDLVSAKEQLEYRLLLLEKFIPACLTVIQPRDFVVMGGGDDAPCYLQDIGCQRIKPLVGGITRTKPEAEKIVLDNGQFFFRVTGWYGSTLLGTEDFVIGGRSSEEGFFDRWDDAKPPNRLPVHPLLLEKAARTSWENRAISGIAGLRGMTVGALKARGFDIGGARSVSFIEGRQGGAGKGGSITLPNFGPKTAWGKAIDDPTLSDADLLWWQKKCVVDIADEAQAKYKPLNQKRLAAIETEVARRKTNAEANPAEAK